jgi:hypothetical protein
MTARFILQECNGAIGHGSGESLTESFATMYEAKVRAGRHSTAYWQLIRDTATGQEWYREDGGSEWLFAGGSSTADRLPQPNVPQIQNGFAEIHPSAQLTDLPLRSPGSYARPESCIGSAP